jgi:hypothetical protein
VIGTDLRDTSQTATPAQTIYAWGAQLEAGAFPTSYIATASSAQTRAADNATLPTAGWYIATAGSVVGDFVGGGWTGGTARNGGLASFDDGAGNGQNAINVFGYFNSNTFIQPNLNVRVANVTTGASGGSGTNTNIVSGSVVRIGATFTAAAITTSINGSLPASIGGGALPAGVSRLIVGLGYAGILALCGAVSRIRYWPRPLADFELQAVTLVATSRPTPEEPEPPPTIDNELPTPPPARPDNELPETPTPRGRRNGR